MSIIKAYAMPHPPLAIPEIGRGQEKEIADILTSMEKAGSQIADIAPETIIYITPHNTIYSDYFHISPGHSASGNFNRFGQRGISFETEYDIGLVNEISRIAADSAIAAGTQGERDKQLDHGVMVPMWYINKYYTKYKTIRISQSGMPPVEHYRLGQIITKASENLGRRVVVIGSSDLSHRLKSDGPYGFAPEGPEFDRLITETIKNGDFLALLKIPEKIREAAGECGYNSLIVLAGIFDRKNVKTELFSYGGPFGVGYAVAGFEAAGNNEKRNISDIYIKSVEDEAAGKQNMEDEYQKLARASLEHKIKSGRELALPQDLSDELTDQKAGVFVSLHKGGRLRGCIGTIAPVTNCIAEEIIRNAVSAGLSDTRFPPVTADELGLLTYKVDVLSAPEKIDSPDQLDVKRYGVIVTSGYRRGLLLPNLDGIDTVEEQIDIARSKGGISKGDPITLERFEVIRHES